MSVMERIQKGNKFKKERREEERHVKPKDVRDEVD
jgi:hypothetical protein